MRLWHIDLISVLPKKQLLGQWRELNSIFKLQNKHVLINFVYNYDKKILYNYSNLVISEMKKRNYKVNLFNYDNYFKMSDVISCPYVDIFHGKMNERYLKQCYYNLQEKYDCGAITENEWLLIKNKCGDVI